MFAPSTRLISWTTVAVLACIAFVSCEKQGQSEDSAPLFGGEEVARL